MKAKGIFYSKTLFINYCFLFLQSENISLGGSKRGCFKRIKTPTFRNKPKIVE